MTDFRFLKNQELIEKLQSLAGLEKKTTAEIVTVIAEVDRRKLFLDLGHASLFSYLTAELGYTAASAQRRIDAARLLSAVPEMKSDIESGALNLMQISVVSQSLRRKKKESPKVSVGVSEKRELLEQVKGLDLVQTQKLGSQALDLDVQVHERKRVQKDESLRVELTLSKAQQEKLQLAREILSHKHPSLSWAELFEVLADELIKRRDPRRDPRRAQKSDPKHRDSNKQRPPSPTTPTTPATPTPLTETKLFKWGENLRQNQKENPQDLSLSPTTGEPTATELANAGERIDTAQTRETPMVGSRMEAKPKHKPNSKIEAALNQTISNYKRKPIPLAIKRAVFQRDQDCQWRDPITNRKCGSRFQLEMDHLKPVCEGGEDHIKNLQLLCDVHNRIKWRKERSGSRASPP